MGYGNLLIFLLFKDSATVFFLISPPNTTLQTINSFCAIILLSINQRCVE